jgi:acyl dehydratase
MPEATSEFKQNLKIAFDSINVEQTFTFRRTFTEGDVAMFCGVTGDYNPYHIDEIFIRESWFGRKIIMIHASIMNLQIHICSAACWITLSLNYAYLHLST